MPARAFIPTATPEQHRVQFDGVLAMVEALKQSFANIGHPKGGPCVVQGPWAWRCLFLSIFNVLKEVNALSFEPFLG